MKKIYFTPGPSQLYPTIPLYIRTALKLDIASISHRGKEFENIFSGTVLSLRELMNIPKTHQVFFLSSSLEAMERILQNTVKKNSFHFVNGEFSRKWHQFALDLGKKPKKIEVASGNGFNFEEINIPKKTELLCITQNETSTGVCLPMKEIYTLKEKFPYLPIALDIVSSAPYPEIDFSKIDMAFFSVQKGFGLHAGLAVLIINNNLMEKSSGTFHSFQSLQTMAKKNQTPETPNVLYIYLLGKVCEDMLKKGIRTIRKETEEKAKLLYEFAENSTVFKPFVKEKKFRSPTTIVFELINNKSSEVVSKLEKKGLMIGKGYGEFKEKHIRIANFPAHSASGIKILLKTFE